ncbi:MAG: hypothetical protein JW915_19070 [Chitinispirillaceae bacterium]|nr:hypothetical protein [Chitinispirillaceae bacterium]
MCGEIPSNLNRILYKNSDTAYVALQGKDLILLQFGKIGLTLSAEEIRLFATMMKKTESALHDSSRVDPVIAFVGIGEVQEFSEEFFLVRFFNVPFSICKKMLLVLIELCIAAGDYLERSDSKKRTSPVDPDSIDFLETIRAINN